MNNVTRHNFNTQSFAKVKNLHKRTLLRDVQKRAWRYIRKQHAGIVTKQEDQTKFLNTKENKFNQNPSRGYTE